MEKNGIAQAPNSKESISLSELTIEVTSSAGNRIGIMFKITIPKAKANTMYVTTVDFCLSIFSIMLNSFFQLILA